MRNFEKKEFGADIKAALRTQRPWALGEGRSAGRPAGPPRPAGADEGASTPARGAVRPTREEEEGRGGEDDRISGEGTTHRISQSLSQNGPGTTFINVKSEEERHLKTIPK